MSRTKAAEWKEKYGDVDPFAGDDKPAPSEYEGDKPYDSRGCQYNPYAGSQSPSEGRCNCMLKYYDERYGEPRYCTRLPENCFVDGGSRFCKTHKSHEALMENAAELYKHGAFAKNYTYIFDKISGEEKLFAIDTFVDLLERSVYDFEEEYVKYDIDCTDTDVLPYDTIERQFPVPQRKLLEASRLWHAALDTIRMIDMQGILIEDGPETEQLAATADMEGQITDERTNQSEHHLNLPLSRLTKDHEKHLTVGGVLIDDEDEQVTVDNRSWTLEYAPSESAESDAEPSFVDDEVPVPDPAQYDE